MMDECLGLAFLQPFCRLVASNCLRNTTLRLIEFADIQVSQNSKHAGLLEYMRRTLPGRSKGEASWSEKYRLEFVGYY